MKNLTDFILEAAGNAEKLLKNPKVKLLKEFIYDNPKSLGIDVEYSPFEFEDTLADKIFVKGNKLEISAPRGFASSSYISLPIAGMKGKVPQLNIGEVDGYEIFIPDEEYGGNTITTLEGLFAPGCKIYDKLRVELVLPDLTGAPEFVNELICRIEYPFKSDIESIVKTFPKCRQAQISFKGPGNTIAKEKAKDRRDFGTLVKQLTGASRVRINGFQI